MNPEEVDWLKTFVTDERKRRTECEEMADEDYLEAGAHFDLFAMQKLNTVSTNIEQKDEAYRKREKELKELIIKKNTSPPVSTHK